MRVVEIYEAGGFPKLVLEAKKEFAATYGLQSEYWRHFDVADSPEVLSYLKANLVDLANHYHALYQSAEVADEKPANFQEATRWYRAYLTSFPADPGSPAVNHRLADLLLEHRDFGEAAREYERTAYDYPAHEQAAAAGYAAIYAHRENQKRAAGAEQEAARRDAVTSTLRFVDAFPQHEHAAAVLGAAVDDLYDMKEFAPAIATGRKLIDGYPEADAVHPALRLDGRRPFLLRDGRLRAGRAGLRAGARDDARGRRLARRPWSTTWPRRSTSRASRRTSPASIGRPPITSCGSRRPRPPPRSGRRPSTTPPPR